MTTHRALFDFLSADPESIRAALRASQRGVRCSCNGKEAMRHLMIDAAEEVGCPVEELDLRRNHHVTVIRRALIAMIEDDIASQSPDATTDTSPSSYAQ